MKDHLIIGKIVGAHGVRGEMKILPITDGSRRFSDLSEVILLSPDEKPILLLKNRARVRIFPCTAEGITDRNVVTKMTGHFFAVPRTEALALPEDRFYIADLIGCTVIDDKMGQLGIVSDLLQQAGADVFVVKRYLKKDLLFPFLKTIVYHIDIKAGEIAVRLPDGLYEIYES